MAGKKPYIAVLVVQFIYAGLGILSKAAFNGGMNTFVFVFYRQAISTSCLLPIALAFGSCRRTSNVKLSPKLATKLFLSSFIGITVSLNTYNVGIKYTSATVAAASLNSIPVITFFIALLLQMEIITLKSISGIVKVFGVALCVSGVLVIAFYRGPHLKSWNHHQPILHGSDAEHGSSNSKGDWVLGSFLLLISTVSWSMWIVLQGIFLAEYPAKFLFTALSCFFSTTQAFLVGLAFERDFSKWKLHMDEGLLAVVYSGIFVSGIASYLMTWSIEKEGPVFVAMSTPLNLIITLACSSFLLGEVISLGSVLGGVLLVAGLYTVLWGKSQERTNQKTNIEEGVGETELQSAVE